MLIKNLKALSGEKMKGKKKYTDETVNGCTAKKKILFLCSSPFTVFNSLNMVCCMNSGLYEDIDIALFHKTNAITKISKKLQGSGIFHHVYNYKDIQLSKCKVVIMLLIFLFPKFMLKKMRLDPGKKKLSHNYDIIISQNWLFLSMVLRMNKKAKLYKIEEGIGSYLKVHGSITTRSVYLQCANKLLFHNRLENNYYGLIVYRPDLLYQTSKDIFKLPQMQEQFSQLYFDIFQYKKNTLYKNHKYIIFGGGEMNLSHSNVKIKDSLSSDFMGLYDIINVYIVQKLKRYDILYRKHPAEQHPVIENIEIDNLNNIWEIECGEQIQDHHILISYISSCMWTPKILYGKEPTLVFMYPLLSLEKEKMLSMDSYVKKLKSIYSDPERIHIVSSTEELEKVLSIL